MMVDAFVYSGDKYREGVLVYTSPTVSNAQALIDCSEYLKKKESGVPALDLVGSAPVSMLFGTVCMDDLLELRPDIEGLIPVYDIVMEDIPNKMRRLMVSTWLERYKDYNPGFLLDPKELYQDLTMDGRCWIHRGSEPLCSFDGGVFKNVRYFRWYNSKTACVAYKEETKLVQLSSGVWKRLPYSEKLVIQDDNTCMWYRRVSVKGDYGGFIYRFDQTRKRWRLVSRDVVYEGVKEE